MCSGEVAMRMLRSEILCAVLAWDNPEASHLRYESPHCLPTVPQLVSGIPWGSILGVELLSVGSRGLVGG